MQLRWLHSPAAAPTAASSLAVALSLLSSTSNLALATDVALESKLPDPQLNGIVDAQNDLGDVYEPEFAAFDRSLIGRAPIPEGVKNLQNNEPETWQVDVAETYCFILEKDTINKATTQKTDEREEVQSRQADDGVDVMLSATTCLQPYPKTEDQEERVPPQLTMFYVDTTYEDCMKGADRAPVGQSRTFDEGLAQQNLYLEKDVYVGITAPNTTNFQNVWNFELAASKDDWYHGFSEDSASDAELLWMDSDSSAALLQTQNLTTSEPEVNGIMKEGPIYEFFVQNDNYKVFDGISRSVCAMKQNALIHANKNNDGRLNGLVNTTMTKQGPGGYPKQQFYFEGLNSSSSYSGILFRTKREPSMFDTTEEEKDRGVGPGKIGGGGVVYDLVNFRTSAGKSEISSR